MSRSNPAPRAAALAAVLRRTSHYAGASVVAMVTGLISYPLFTRTLDVEDYGAMALVHLVLLAATAGAKLGLQNAIVRLWPAHDDSDAACSRFASTFFTAALALGAAAALVCLVADAVLHPLLPRRLVWPLAVAALLVPVRALASYAENFLRARERSRASALTSIGASLLGLGLGAAAVVWLMPPAHRLPGLYLGLLAAEAVVVVLALRAAFAGIRLQAAAFHWPLAREALGFGVPLVLAEMATLGLLFADRVILGTFRGERELGLYAAAFGLAWQVATLFARPIEMAVVPAYTRLYEREGPRAAGDFLAQMTRGYWLVALPMAAGLWAVREDVILVLASAKYRAAQDLLPVLLAGFLVYGVRIFAAAGLFLAKRTRVIALAALAGAILNVVLNVALVRPYGATGSAWATSISLTVVTVVYAVLGRRDLAFDLGLRRLPLYALGAAIMAGAVSLVRFAPAEGGRFGEHLLQLVARLVVGVAVYGVFALIVEPPARAFAARLVRPRRGPAPVAAAASAPTRTG